MRFFLTPLRPLSCVRQIASCTFVFSDVVSPISANRRSMTDKTRVVPRFVGSSVLGHGPDRSFGPRYRGYRMVSLFSKWELQYCNAGFMKWNNP